MAKVNPYHQYDSEVGMTGRFKDFVKDLHRRIKKDKEDRAQWEEDKTYYFKRRYGLLWRNPDFPWPGSSNIVMPLIDMMIDKLKPLYANLVLQAKPPVTVLTHGGAEVANQARKIEQWFDWLIRAGSPQFGTEIVLAIDDLLETGRGIVKTLWQYDTCATTETLVPSRLPKRLAQMIPRINTAQDADRASAMLGVNVLSREEFKENEGRVRQMVQVDFQLDPEEDADRKVADQILSWMRSGAKQALTIERRDILWDAPRIAQVHPFDLIVPSYTTDLEETERITHVMWMSDRQIRQRARDAKWNRSAVRDLLEKRSREKDKYRSASRGYDHTLVEESLREGVNMDHTDAQFEIYECATWFDVNGDGVDEKVCVLYSPENPDAVLKAYEYRGVSSGNRWPYHTATFEKNKRRWYSPRGIPEKLDDLDAEVTAQHRAKLNRSAISNAPTFFYRTNSGINPRNFRWVPGQMFPTMNPLGDVVPVQIPNLDLSFDQEQHILRTWAEQYVGTPDFGLTSQDSMTEPRTATELRQIAQQGNQALSLRGSLFQHMMASVYDSLHDLWVVYGPDEVWVRITGTEPLRLTKEELQGDYLFIPTGIIGEQDPIVEAQKSLARIQILTQVGPLMGLRYELDMGEAVRDWLEKDDVRVYRRIVRERSPEEVQQLQQQQQQQQERMEAAVGNYRDMPPQELEMALKDLEARAPNKGKQRISM